jgi:gliding motility-associated-like protein
VNYINVRPVPIACGETEEDLSHPYDLSQSTFHFVNCSQYATSYSWSFGDGFTSTEENPTHTYNSIDSFYVVLTASNGFCDDTFKIGPIIIILIDEVHFPTAFSPNGDGYNDFFHELGGIGITDLYYAIYDRWGELIFETNDQQSKGWDGTYKGEECEVDVYVWKSRATFISGSQKAQSGNVTLVR